MYKTILWTLSALSIVTITASAGFAQSTSATDCAAPWNQDHEDCTVSTKIWLDDFTPSIKSIGATNGADNGFVEFGAKGFKDDNNQFIIPGNPKRGKLNLKADVVKDNGKTVNKTIGGVLFYRDLHMASSSYLYYAGIKSGTNLGRPLTNALAGASWTKDWTGGKFKAVGGRDYYNVDEDDFTLNVIFNGETGTMSALVQQAGQAHYRIAGEFDSKGVITGTVTYGLFDISRSKTTPHSDVGRIDGTLSGLIGDQGAVGVFVSDTNRDSYGVYGFAGGFVVNSHFTAAEAALLRRCAADPFDSGCSDEKYDAPKIARIEHCVTDNNWVSDSDCFSALIATGSTTGDRVSCISNPFQTACKDANANYAEQYMTARDNRVAFCVDSTNSGSEACREVDVVAGVCGVNPFGAVCEDSGDSTTHNDRRVELMNNCNDDNMDNNAGCPAIRYIIDACEEKPFGANCGFDAFDDERKTLTGYCLGESPNILCTDDIRDEALKRPNAATWVNSFKTEDNPQGLRDGAGVISLGHQFLKNIKSAQSNENIQILEQQSRTIYKSLNLKTVEFNGTALGGHEEDGVAYFHGKAAGQSRYHYYAGIFSTTDLGAPITTETGTASWVGSFREGSYSSSKDFVLEVNFEGKSIEAFIADYGISSQDYYLKGDYDDNGVISGTVTSNYFTDNNRAKPTYNSSGGTLTGLIGKEGAVGVYLTGGFVARPADLVVDENTNKNAETFLNETCATDPFHEFCYLSDERKERIVHCSKGDNAINTDDNALNWDCMTDVESDPCILHPFDAGCAPTATSHYEIARENRSDFCNKTANTGDSFNTLCTGAEQVALCSYDPFHRLCSDTLYDNVRKAVCKAGSSHSDCATEAYRPSSNVTAINWLSDIYKDNGVILGTEPDTIRPRDQFLQGTEDGLDNGDVEIFTFSDDGESLYNTLNLNTATFDGMPLRGDAADGVAFFYGANYKRYAGIFSGTDLGEPLVKPTEEADMTATWYGQFHDGLFLKTDFTLGIDFSAGSTDGSVGTVEAFVHSGYSEYYHLLKGKFDDNGVISGTVVNGIFPNHDRIASRIYATTVLTGLIGAEGAVGVFGVSDGEFYNFGGFVAAPVVSYANWVNSFDTPLLSSPTLTTTTLIPTLKNQFLKDGGTDLSTGDFKDIKPGNLNLKDTTSGDTSLGGQDTNGVDFSRGTRKAGTGINKKFFYAEILSGTNLGQPIIDNSLDGSWLGIFESINHTGDARTVDFMLNVSFGNAGNKAGSINAVISGIRNEYNPFKIIGTFDANGVISGDIYHSGYLFSFPNHPDGPGTLTGLIGSGGAVGAFISTATGDDGYVGGFVAAPHVTETSIGYLDWVNSFDTPLLATPSIPDNPRNRFLKDGGTDLSGDDFKKLATGNLNLATATYDGTLLDVNGNAADGVAFSRGTPNTTFIGRYYAEILSGTNLGQPITDGTKDGIWKGSLGFIGVSESVDMVDLDLNVSFGSTTPNAAGDIDATIDAGLLLGNNPFVLTGTFNNKGVIEGTTSDLANRTPNGTLTGLIGQQGAVGAFISNSATGVYSGGFVAVPPAAETASP